MTPVNPVRTVTTPVGRRRLAGAAAAVLVLTGSGLSGCGFVSAVNKVRHTVDSNKATIDAFTGRLKSGESATYVATYVTTSSSPATIVYAVQAPDKLLFRGTPSGSGSAAGHLDIVMNSSGEYSCSPPSAASSRPRWACQKLGKAGAAARNAILGFYSPAHWVTFLKYFSLAAGFAGDKVTSSAMTVNGFSMQCVDFRAPGVTGISRICTTAQGILGYVKVASDPTSFEIRKYSASPPPSLFKLPPGARVTRGHGGSS